MRRIEQVIVRLDDGVPGALLRFALGGVIPPAWLALMGPQSPGWTLAPFFLAVLLAVRVLPALVRKRLRFSDSALGVWSERRQLAKRCDSYQWQKLFWIGLGLSLSTSLWAPRRAALLVLAFSALVSGGLGLVTWRYRSAPREGARRRSDVKDRIGPQGVDSAVLTLRSES